MKYPFFSMGNELQMDVLLLSEVTMEMQSWGKQWSQEGYYFRYNLAKHLKQKGFDQL